MIWVVDLVRAVETGGRGGVDLFASVWNDHEREARGFHVLEFGHPLANGPQGDRRGHGKKHARKMGFVWLKQVVVVGLD